MNKFLRILKYAVCIVFTLMFLLIAFVTVSGAKGYSVASDSMAPKLNRGDVVFVKETDFDDLKKGDIVTVEFKIGDGTTYTHRIISIDYDKKEIKTAGDKTGVEDMEGAAESQIKGKVWFSLPLLGYLSLMLTNRTYVAVLVLAALLITVVGAYFAQHKKNERGEENEHKEEVNN